MALLVLKNLCKILFLFYHLTPHLLQTTKAEKPLTRLFGNSYGQVQQHDLNMPGNVPPNLPSFHLSIVLQRPNFEISTSQ
jgi:hypothetical protein